MIDINWIKVNVRFFANLRDVFDSHEVEIRMEIGGTIRDLLELVGSSNKRRQALFEQPGQLKPYIKILRNGRNIDFLKGMDTQLTDGDILSIFPPLGGG